MLIENFHQIGQDKGSMGKSYGFLWDLDGTKWRSCTLSDVKS